MKLLKLLFAFAILQNSVCMAQLVFPTIYSGNGGVLNTNSSGVASITATPTLGVGSTTTGRITFQNSTNNNTLTFQPGASASNLMWTLPITDMAWMRAVCGRLESRYQYSAGIVYNNLPWPKSPHQEQKRDIEKAAKAVLAARKAFPESTLADLYDPLSMPLALQKAHQQLDRAVDVAYSYKGSKDDASRVAFLFKLYQQYTSLLPSALKLKSRKAAR